MPTDIVGSEILQTDSDGNREFKFTKGPIFSNLILADEINRTPPKTQAALLEAMQEKQVTVAGQTRKLDEPFIVFADEEEKIINLTTGKELPTADKVMDASGVLALQEAVTDMPLPENVVKAILKLTHSTRPGSEHATDYVNNYLAYGAGPRASQCLAKAVRALALLRGKSAASIDELKDAALPILRHRITPNYNATGEGITEDDIIAKLIAQ